MSEEVLRYRLDADDRIADVDEAWLRFARENGAPQLTRGGVVGRPLRRFVEGAGLWHLWELLFSVVRESGEPITLPFRCDSPTLRRFMQMTVAPAGEGGLELSVRLEREEPGAAASPSGSWVRVCSWCKRVLLPDGRWEDPGAAVTELDLVGSQQGRPLTGGVCPPCRQGFEERVAPRRRRAS